MCERNVKVSVFKQQRQAKLIVDSHFQVYFIIKPSWPSRLGLWNTPTASQQKGKSPTTGFLDMILNNLLLRVRLEFWGMQITSLLPSLSAPLRSGVVATDSFLSMGQ